MQAPTLERLTYLAKSDPVMLMLSGSPMEFLMIDGAIETVALQTEIGLVTAEVACNKRLRAANQRGHAH